MSLRVDLSFVQSRYNLSSALWCVALDRGNGRLLETGEAVERRRGSPLYVECQRLNGLRTGRTTKLIHR